MTFATSKLQVTNHLLGGVLLWFDLFEGCSSIYNYLYLACLVSCSSVVSCVILKNCLLALSRSSKTGPSGQLSPQRYVSMYVHYLMMKMVRLHRRKVVLCLLAVFVVIFLLRYWKQSTLDWVS